MSRKGTEVLLTISAFLLVHVPGNGFARFRKNPKSSEKNECTAGVHHIIEIPVLHTASVIASVIYDPDCYLTQWSEIPWVCLIFMTNFNGYNEVKAMIFGSVKKSQFITKYESLMADLLWKLP